MQFGTPITIIRGGSKAIKEDKRKSKKATLPKDHITAIDTTIRQIKTTLIERKNKNNKAAVTSKERPMKKTISDKILFDMRTRKCGRPA